MLVTEDGPGGTVRYAMLETLRQYARERLDETGDADRWRRRHAEHYATWADAAEAGAAGPDAVRWVQVVRAEIDNVRAAVGWALDTDDLARQELGARIVARLAVLANFEPEIGIGVLAMLALPVVDALPADLRAQVLSAAGYHALNVGALDQARTLARAAVRDGVVGTSLGSFQPHQNLMVIEMLSGDPAASFAAADEARASLDAVESPFARATLLSSLAAIGATAGQGEQARVDAERGLALARESQNPIALASAYFGLGWSLVRDDPAAALSAFEQYLDLYRSSGIGAGSAGSAYSLAGGLRSMLGNPTGGLEYLREAVVISRDQGLRTQVAAALDWTFGPLLRTASPQPVAIFIGALRDGSLAGLDEFPGVDAARDRALARVRAALGDDVTDRLLAEGAAMAYDDLVAYAVDQVRPPAEPDQEALP
jgi:tetratricopeptide (TPR) repeat protein